MRPFGRPAARAPGLCTTLTALALGACTPAQVTRPEATPLARAAPTGAATAPSEDETPIAAAIERIEVCAPGAIGELELFPHARLLVARCGGECKVMPIDATGVLGPAARCDLGSPALRRKGARIETLAGEWPRQAVLGTRVLAVPEEGEARDVLALAFQVGREGRWIATESPERGPYGVGEWTGGTLVSPTFDGAKVRFFALAAPAGVPLPAAPPHSGILRVHNFASLASGDALLTAEGHDRLVVWRWSAGAPRPVVDELPGRMMNDPASPDFHPVALRSATDLWIGVHSSEVPGPQVLHCDGTTWTPSHSWPPTDDRGAPAGRIEEIALGSDGAVWVHMSGGSRAGVWRRRPGTGDRWDHVAADQLGRDRPFALERMLPVGADLLVVGSPGGSGAAEHRLMRIRVGEPGSSR